MLFWEFSLWKNEKEENLPTRNYLEQIKNQHKKHSTILLSSSKTLTEYYGKNSPKF